MSVEYAGAHEKVCIARQVWSLNSIAVEGVHDDASAPDQLVPDHLPCLVAGLGGAGFGGLAVEGGGEEARRGRRGRETRVGVEGGGAGS